MRGPVSHRERIELRLGGGVTPSWGAWVRAAGLEERTEVERIRVQRAPDHVRAALRLGRMARVFVIARRRFADGHPAACAVSYVVSEAVPDLPAQLSRPGSTGSLWSILSDAYA